MLAQKACDRFRCGVGFFLTLMLSELLFFSTVSKLRDEITASHEGQFCGIKWSRFYVFLSAIFKMCDHLFFLSNLKNF